MKMRDIALACYLRLRVYFDEIFSGALEGAG